MRKYVVLAAALAAAVVSIVAVTTRQVHAQSTSTDISQIEWIYVPDNHGHIYVRVSSLDSIRFMAPGGVEKASISWGGEDRKVFVDDPKILNILHEVVARSNRGPGDVGE